jgi:hypothetical protein
VATKKKRGVALSDLHFGSSTGLLPKGFIDSNGAEVLPNIGQKYLWECWIDFNARVKQFKPDFVVIDGDIVEGTQRKEGGAGLSLRLMQDQKAAAVEGLQLLKKAAGCPFYFVQGTNYHVGTNGESEEDVAAMLDAKKYLSVGPGRFVREVLWLDIDGVVIEAAHSISGASGFYRATQVDKEMQWSAMSAKDSSKGIPKADILIRAHVHNFIYVEHASKQGFTLPCWQLQNTYARNKSVHRFHPDLGGIFMEIDPAAKKHGEPPCRVIKQLYSLPPVPVTKL